MICRRSNIIPAWQYPLGGEHLDKFRESRKATQAKGMCAGALVIIIRYH